MLPSHFSTKVALFSTFHWEIMSKKSMLYDVYRNLFLMRTLLFLECVIWNAIRNLYRWDWAPHMSTNWFHVAMRSQKTTKVPFSTGKSAGASIYCMSYSASMLSMNFFQHSVSKNSIRIDLHVCADMARNWIIKSFYVKEFPGISHVKRQ